MPAVSATLQVLKLKRGSYWCQPTYGAIENQAPYVVGQFAEHECWKIPVILPKRWYIKCKSSKRDATRLGEVVVTEKAIGP